MAALSPTTVFSPSVARQQRIAAKDWTYVDAWLAAKFSPDVPPPFERTPDTLRALLALAAHNEAADDERDLLAAAEKQEYDAAVTARRACAQLDQTRADDAGEQDADDADDAAGLIVDLNAHLPPAGHAALTALAASSVLLDIAEPSVPTLARRLQTLTAQQHALAQASERVAALQASLARETARLQAWVEEVDGCSASSPTLDGQTADRQRQTRVLESKLPELEARVAALQRRQDEDEKQHGKRLTVRDAKAEEERFRGLLVSVRDVEAQVHKYHGLPPDVDMARREVERVQAELRDVTRQRDGMFEGLVERESPRKTR